MGDYNMLLLVTMLALGTVIVLCVLWTRQSTDFDSLGDVSQGCSPMSAPPHIQDGSAE